MVHTDTCFLDCGIKPFLPDMVSHWNRFLVMIPLCAIFLCPAVVIFIQLVTNLI